MCLVLYFYGKTNKTFLYSLSWNLEHCHFKDQLQALVGPLAGKKPT